MIDVGEALNALYAISPDLPHDDWIRVGMSAQAAGLPFDVFDAWSAGASNYEYRAALKAWRSFKSGQGIGPGTLFRTAKEHGWRGYDRELEQRRHRQPCMVQRVAEAVQRQQLSNDGQALWSSGHPIEEGTPAAEYLRLRRCAQPPMDGHLRWLPGHEHHSGHIGPCLMALLSDAETAELRSLHFTWIDGGRKASVVPPRLNYKGHQKAGTVCRLWPLKPGVRQLGISEGIETALSLAHGMTPVWACIDAGNLRNFPVLPDVNQLVIARDHDPTGERAAKECIVRWNRAGREVLVTRQETNDLNDLLQGLGDGV